MSEEIKTNKPNVAIRGNPDSLKIYNGKESLSGPGGVPNFGSALNELASSPTTLGSIGSKLMQNSSIALATKFGQSLGKEPQGNLLPPITNFDKYVTDSYTTQAQVTLGNQANALLYNSQEEIAKANKLTPDLINDYKTNVSKGFQQTLELAPDSIRPQLENQFLHQLNSTTHELNLKLTSQQKSQQESDAQVWRINQNDTITNMVKDAEKPKDFELAKQSYDSLLQNIANSNLTPLQKATATTTAKLNYQSALSIQKLMNARQSGKEDAYLSSIADKKIPGLSWSESEQVRDNTVKYLGAVETAENRDQNLIISEAGLEIAEGSFNESKLAELRNKLREENYNKVATKWAVQQRKTNIENVSAQSIVSSPGNATTYEGLTPKQINHGFDLLKAATIQKAQANGNPITDDEAEFRVASIMNTIVPKYIDRINRELSNGNPQQALNGLETYERLHELDGNKVLGIDEKALAVGEIFKNMLAKNSPEHPLDIDAALTNAKEIVYSKDEDIIKNNNALIHAYMMKHASTPANRLSNAVKLSGLGNSNNIDNQAAFEADMYSRFNGYMQLTNGDEAVSESRTQKDVSKIWANSRVNGKEQHTRLGIEQAIGLPTNAAPLIQEDIIKQLEPQLISGKDLFDKGGSPHYWRIKEGRINYQDYAKAKLTIQEIGRNDPDYANHSQLIKDYEKAPPIEIEQVTRNGTETWHLDVQSSAYAQRSLRTGKVSGYNIGIIKPETGEKGQLYGYYGETHIIPTYSPNENWIIPNYIGVNNLQGLNPEDYIKNRILEESEGPKDIIDYRRKLLRER